VSFNQQLGRWKEVLVIIDHKNVRK